MNGNYVFFDIRIELNIVIDIPFAKTNCRELKIKFQDNLKAFKKLPRRSNPL